MKFTPYPVWDMAYLSVNFEVKFTFTIAYTMNYNGYIKRQSSCLLKNISERI